MKPRMIVFIIAVVSISIISGTALVQAAESSYRFTFAQGPWDLAEGRIALEDQPDDPYFQYVEKTLGTVPLTISWEWEGRTGYVQGLRLYLASGELPEAMRTVDSALTTELIEADMLIALDDLLPQYAPELFAAIPEEMWNLIRAQAPDGKIYYIPQPQAPFRIRTGFIRKDWLEHVGMEVPATRDELVTVYRAFKEQDANGNGDPNDEIPVSGREGMRWCDDLFIIHGVKMWEGFPQLEWDQEQQQMISHQVSNQMKHAVAFLRDLVAEGLMDATMPIQKNQDWRAKIKGNRVGHYYHIVNVMELFADNVEKDAESVWTYLPPVSVPGVPPQQHNFAAVDPSTPVLAITQAAKDPAKILQWFNYFASTPEGHVYTMLGIPGHDWTRQDDRIEVLNANIPAYKYAPRNDYTIYIPEVLATTAFGKSKVEIMQQALKTGYVGFDDAGMPLSVYDGYEDFRPEKSVLFQEYASKIVLGTLPMSAWDDYVAEWHKRGGGEVLKRATDWYKKVYNIQ